jgi:hypothetical protein
LFGSDWRWTWYRRLRFDPHNCNWEGQNWSSNRIKLVLKEKKITYKNIKKNKRNIMEKKCCSYHLLFLVIIYLSLPKWEGNEKDIYIMILPVHPKSFLLTMSFLQSKVPYNYSCSFFCISFPLEIFIMNTWNEYFYFHFKINEI